MKGFKVFNPDFTCRNYQFEVGKTYEHHGEIEVCSSGFHFCQRAVDCFEYYNFDPHNKVAEVEAIGEVKTDGNKSVTNEIRIIRELGWHEVLDMVNTGQSNTGLANSGDWNSGDRNSGDRNSGDRNSGDWNSGNRNSGNWNSGDRNSGDWNSGDRNSGNWNSGDWNSGDRNSGNWNSGDWNSGDRNSGDWNSGNRNSGNWNSGDYNSTNFSSGAFCTEDPKILIFDKPSDLIYRQWVDSKAYRILRYHTFKLTQWTPKGEMTDTEKEDNPGYEARGGYLKTIPYKEAWRQLWDSLSADEKKVVMEIPNFDADKFEQITGIRVHG